MISELCNPEVLFHLNAPPTHYTFSSRTFIWIKLGSKNKNIQLRDFKDAFSSMDFNFSHFSNFNFAHFEIEVSFGYYLKGPCFKCRLSFPHFVYKGSFGQIWVKTTE